MGVCVRQMRENPPVTRQGRPSSQVGCSGSASATDVRVRNDTHAGTHTRSKQRRMRSTMTCEPPTDLRQPQQKQRTANCSSNSSTSPSLDNPWLQLPACARLDSLLVPARHFLARRLIFNLFFSERTPGSTAIKCWTIMLQLEGAKCSFLFCLGICMLICSVIYLRVMAGTDPQGQSGPQGCRPFSKYCQAFIPSTKGSPAWQRRDCQVESYLLGMGSRGGDQDCSRLVRELHFITRPLSREEEDYPLAFILTVHKELELLVRLLRAIYTPQNVYCVHVDAKAPREYREAVESLVGCFPNVFLASHSEMVTYAGFSRLQADINCMRDLAASPVPWRKVLNLCGQDFPVKSNLELVRYMQSKEWRDRNMTPGIKQPAAMRHRTQLQYREVRGSHVAPKRGGPKKGAPPHRLQIYFGTAYYALTRTFVEFVLRSHVSRDLLEWSKDAFSPDEHYWVTLNHIKEAPGSHVGGGWGGEIRTIKWRDQEGTVHNGCKGRYVRDICIYGLEDLQWIIDRNSMFANKFESKAFPEALDCLEQWHRDKVLQQAMVPIQSWWQLATQGNATSLFNATVGL